MKKPFMMYVQQRRKVEVENRIVLVFWGPIFPLQAMACDRDEAAILTMKQAHASGLQLPVHI